MDPCKTLIMLLLKFKVQHHKATSISSLPGSNLILHSVNSSREEHSRSLHSSSGLESSWTRRAEDLYKVRRREVLRNSKRAAQGKPSLRRGSLASIFRVAREHLKGASNAAGKIISLQQLKEVDLGATVVLGREEGVPDEERVFERRGIERIGRSIRGGGESGVGGEDNRGVQRKPTEVVRL